MNGNEDLARTVEQFAFLDEKDHPEVLVDAIATLIRSIHELAPELKHSEDWYHSVDPQLAAQDEARWRGVHRLKREV